MTGQAGTTHVQSWAQRRLPGGGPGLTVSRTPSAGLHRSCRQSPPEKWGKRARAGHGGPRRTRPPLPALGAPGCHGVGQTPPQPCRLQPHRPRSSAQPGLSWGPPGPHSSAELVPACAEPRRRPMLLTRLGASRGGLQGTGLSPSSVGEFCPGVQQEGWALRSLCHLAPGTAQGVRELPGSVRDTHHSGGGSPPHTHRGGCHSRTRVPGHRRPHTQAPGTCSPLRQCRAPPWMTKPHHTCPCGHHVADANIFQKPKAQRTELSILKPLDLNSTPPSGLTPLPRAGRGSWTEACGCVLGVHTSCV